MGLINLFYLTVIHPAILAIKHAVEAAIVLLVLLSGISTSAIRKIYTKRSTSSRQKANLEIITRLQEYAHKHPNQRFGQMLRNTGVVVDIGIKDSTQANHEMPEYFWIRGIIEEPQNTLQRMQSYVEGKVPEIGTIILKKE